MDLEGLKLQAPSLDHCQVLSQEGHGTFGAFVDVFFAIDFEALAHPAAPRKAFMSTIS